jgi:L-rhamnose-H+ transport protein
MDRTEFFNFLLLAASGLIQACFALPLRYFRAWRWEHMWVAQSVTGNVLLPCLWAAFLPHQFWLKAAQVPPLKWLVLFGFGFAWGMGGAAYGLSLARVGIALTYSFTFGLATLTAAVVPILLHWTLPPANELSFAAGLVLSSMAIVGTGLIGVRTAGTHSANNLPLPFAIHSYRWAVIIAILGGILSAAYGLGLSSQFSLVSDLLEAHLSPISAPLIVALPIYAGAASFAIPFGLTISARSHKLQDLLIANSAHNWLLAWLMGLAGVGGVLLFGTGSAGKGHPEPNVSFAIFISFFITGGNLLGLQAGELRGTSVSLKFFYGVATVMLVLGAILLRTS